MSKKDTFAPGAMPAARARSKPSGQAAGGELAVEAARVQWQGAGGGRSTGTATCLQLRMLHKPCHEHPTLKQKVQKVQGLLPVAKSGLEAETNPNAEPATVPATWVPWPAWRAS